MITYIGPMKTYICVVMDTLIACAASLYMARFGYLLQGYPR